MKKILVIQTAFTGDVVLATALLEKLHTFFPNAAIDILVRKGNEGLLLDHPFVHETLIWNKKENKNRNLFSLLLRIRRNRYDIVVNLQRFASTGLLTVFSGANKKIGFDKNPLSFLFTKKIKHLLSDGLHEVERNNKLIEHFTDNTFSKPRLYPTENNFAEIKKYMSVKYICMTPASVWFTKQYPEKKWVELINQIPGEYSIFLLGGKEDAILCEKIKKKTIKTNIEVLAGKLSFLSSAALMRHAVMNYTNDSAPLHFASAVDAPVAAIFCSTIPAFGFYPLSTKSIIVETKEVLSCRPCSIHGLKACPLGHFKCAYTIEIEQLLQAIRE
ncbi:MAG: glycosyltransferase family 9 protein [Ginsengibacter sp.]